MSENVRIGIIGDYDGRPSHVATDQAIEHSAAALSLPVEAHWLPTAALASPDGVTFLERCDGLWAAPGSPYQCIDGALAAISFARVRDWPFVGT